MRYRCRKASNLSKGLSSFSTFINYEVRESFINRGLYYKCMRLSSTCYANTGGLGEYLSILEACVRNVGLVIGCVEIGKRKQNMIFRTCS